jgi:hypothetical protein
MAKISREHDPQPIRGDRGPAIVGPRNIPPEPESGALSCCTLNSNPISSVATCCSL